MRKHKSFEMEVFMKALQKKNYAMLILEGALVGILAGLAAVLYRFLLTWAESGLYTVLDFIKNKPLYAVLWFCILIVLGLLVGVIVRWEGMASGSGIPQVSGELKGQLNPSWWRVLIAKFTGGTLSILGGLSLGREGPSVQLGAMTAKGYARLTKKEQSTEGVLISSGAGAGLAAAFNAPLAGILFILEEIHHAYDKTLLISGLTATVVADFISKLFFGQNVIFTYPGSTVPLSQYWLLLLFGILLGLAGAFYNFFMLKVQGLFQYIKKIPLPIRIVIPFLLAGVLGLFLPQVLAGGHSMVILLENGHPALSFLLLLLLVKFVFSAISFGSGAPGGIFFPLLVLGSYIGAIYGDLSIQVFGLPDALWSQFIILGMAGLFSSITRAPLTGVILIAEMSGSIHRFLDIGVVCMLSYATANLLGSKPIYDSLLDNILKNKR